MKFTYRGNVYNRFDHLYNCTYLNSRGIEIPIASDFVRTHRGRVLEVGNVLGHYPLSLPARTIVDKYEKSPGVRNVDVMDVVGIFDTIVSISTIEHIGLDYGEARDLDASLRAVEHLKTRLAPGGHMMITVPLGWHPTLDPEKFGLEGSYMYWTRDSDWNLTWHEANRLEDVPERSLAYGEETPWAGAVWVGES